MLGLGNRKVNKQLVVGSAILLATTIGGQYCMFPDTRNIFLTSAIYGHFNKRPHQLAVWLDLEIRPK